MKVLYVIDSFAPGGAETSLAMMAPGLVDAGVELHVTYLWERPGVREQLERSGAVLHGPLGSGGRLGRIRALRRLCRELRPDLVHTTLFESDIAGRVAAALARVPVVSSLVNDAYGPEHLADGEVSRFKLAGAKFTDMATARLVRRFHAITRTTAEVMGERLRIPGSKIDVVHRGRDPLAFTPLSSSDVAEVRRSLDVPPGRHLLLAVGRQEHQKGHDVAIEAMRILVGDHVDACLLVAGRDGAETPHLHELVDRYGLHDRVRFLGARGDVNRLVAAADIFVFPSRREGLGGAVIEALACGTPIVCTDLPVLREVLGDLAGTDAARLVPLNDPRSLATHLEQAIAAPRPQHELRARFESAFTLEQSVDGMLHFYEQVTGRPAGRHGGGSVATEGSPATVHAR